MILQRLCGRRLGKALAFTVAVAGGDEDLAINQVDDELDSVKGMGWTMRKQRLIKMRMVASLAVASEFIV